MKESIIWLNSIQLLPLQKQIGPLMLSSKSLYCKEHIFITYHYKMKVRTWTGFKWIRKSQEYKIQHLQSCTESSVPSNYKPNPTSRNLTQLQTTSSNLTQLHKTVFNLLQLHTTTLNLLKLHSTLTNLHYQTKPLKLQKITLILLQLRTTTLNLLQLHKTALNILQLHKNALNLLKLQSNTFNLT